MRVLNVLGALVLCLMMVHAEEEDGSDYAGEFFQGMESGFFLRDTPDGHREYECPDPNLDTEAYAKLQTFWAPIQLVVNYLQNEIVRSTVASIEIFIDSIFKLIGSVKDYQGSDFCSGLLFGMQGSAMILKVGRSIGEQIDIINEVIQKKSPKREMPGI